MSTGSKQNLKNLRVFGSRVWVRPPGIQARRFKSKAQKGIFLGYVPHTTRNIIWYDVESERMKIASHCVFDEGFNDVPVETLPPNVQHILRSTDKNECPTVDPDPIAHTDLEFYVYPFAEKEIVIATIPDNNTDPTFGFQLGTDEIYYRVYVKEIAAKSCASNIFNNLKAFRKRLRGVFITHLNGNPVFSEADAILQLQSLQDQGVKEFSITFAPEMKISGKKLKQAMDNYHHFSPGSHALPVNLPMIWIQSTTDLPVIMLVLQYIRLFQMKNSKVKSLVMTQLVSYIIYCMRMMILKTFIITKFEINRNQCMIYQRDGKDQSNL
jgi:hypothetical protein